jgi:hypothetical protein
MMQSGFLFCSDWRGDGSVMGNFSRTGANIAQFDGVKCQNVFFKRGARARIVLAAAASLALASFSPLVAANAPSAAEEIQHAITAAGAVNVASATPTQFLRAWSALLAGVPRNRVAAYVAAAVSARHDLAGQIVSRTLVVLFGAGRPSLTANDLALVSSIVRAAVQADPADVGSIVTAAVAAEPAAQSQIVSTAIALVPGQQVAITAAAAQGATSSSALQAFAGSQNSNSNSLNPANIASEENNVRSPERPPHPPHPHPPSGT